MKDFDSLGVQGPVEELRVKELHSIEKSKIIRFGPSWFL